MLFCKGDSGSPLYQYVNGVAVLIGIVTGSDSYSLCAFEGEDPVMATNYHYMFVSAIVCYSSVHSRPKHYPTVTTDECGRGLKTRVRDDTCFTFHKHTDVMANMLNGRAIDKGDMPWNVLVILFLGSGVLMNAQWVLTAAHNIFCDAGTVNRTILIYMGIVSMPEALVASPIESDHIHPDYLNADETLEIDDIALIKLGHPVQLDPTGANTGVNSICLPDKNVTNSAKEYAVLNAFGDPMATPEPEGGFNDTNDDSWDRTRLLGGWIVINAAVNDEDTDYYGQFIIGEQYGGAFLCSGDSGGPLYQYVNGVAVLIGIVTGSSSNSTVCIWENEEPIPDLVFFKQY
ncbi:unnamed protein product [Medioppia subpectinata]|uniref:Peptidase S1 domain-containing protein n=1 Tax=Medioppia subpectinata TaxID=1979941 RepID=A0A7R9PZA4_9ACAR|nr:unnamed protein product [Medioppia subpectinata]CAG2105989.1 unnamed protein product [Medioppia subpectinata]